LGFYLCAAFVLEWTFRQGNVHASATGLDNISWGPRQKVLGTTNQ
jgi:hypothetical protein